ncbi:hypothetical protein LCGC14_1611450 [marine sediment metagenome]|uniref:Uncharacterized protein n=1 Tax=marine sediment metagenome TaxID=412755 RepID=A0A0F9I851_9ZZZZ
MGWIMVPNNSTTLGGSTVRFYSIADDIALIHDRLFDFISAVTPGVFSLFLITVIFTLVILLLLSVRAAINRMGDM